MSDRTDANFNLNELLNPASAFEHPSEVVNDPDLTMYEKRALLSAWASYASATEATSNSRAGHLARVSFDDIIVALRCLDKHSSDDKYLRMLRRNRIFRKSGSHALGGAATPLQ